MILNFNFSSKVPIYIQLRNQVVIGIAEGKLKPGEKLPTIRRLAAESGINMMTVSKAYQLLKEEGYILTDRRLGTVVAKKERRNKNTRRNNKSFKSSYIRIKISRNERRRSNRFM